MAPLAPISLASTIIGFISFGFTLLVWLNLFSDAFNTFGAAPAQLRDAFSTLRQALYEEREYLKRKRRRGGESATSRTLYDSGGQTRVINDAVKDLIRDFKNYERPFLVPAEYHEGREKELEWSYDATQTSYYCDFWHRLLWLRCKGGVITIARKLELLQTRRIAVETAETHAMLANVMGMVRDCEDRLGAIEQRLQMSRIG